MKISVIKNNMVKISVIISVHKESPFLSEVIESALSQEFEGYEIILSSDGWEGAYELADKYGIDCIVSSKKNHSHALNNAVKYAKGEYIKEIHWDDILLPNCLSDLWDCRGASVIHADAIIFREGCEERIYHAPESVTWDDLWPPIKNPISCPTMMFKREDFLAVGGRDENIIDGEEYEYYLNLLSNGYRFTHCDKVVAKYRRHTDQKTETYVGKKRMDVWHHLMKKYSNLALQKVNDDLA